MLFTMLLDGIAFLLVFNGVGRYIRFLQLFTILLNDVERCVVFCVLFNMFGMRLPFINHGGYCIRRYQPSCATQTEGARMRRQIGRLVFGMC